MRVDLAGSQGRLLLAGSLLCVLLLLCISWRPDAALSAWLAAAVFWSGVPVGALGFALMMHLVGGTWKTDLEAAAETHAALMPLAAWTFLPVIFGIGLIYPWAGAPEAGFKAVYLTIWFFILRTAVFFAAMITVAALLRRRQGQTALACAGLVLLVVLDSLAAVDWLMSREPSFHASGFGLYVLSIQMTTGFCVLVAPWNSRGVARSVAAVRGGLLLTLLLMDVYFAFMQYIIIWSGNLPHEAAWYLRRMAAPWPVVAWIAAGCTLVPLFLLLFTPIRRDAACVGWIAVAVLLGKALEIAWLALPAPPLGLPFTAVGIVGIGLLFRSRLAPAVKVEEALP